MHISCSEGHFSYSMFNMSFTLNSYCCKFSICGRRYTQHKPRSKTSCIIVVVDKANSAVARLAAGFYSYWHVKPVATLPPQSVYFYRPWKKSRGNPVTQTLLFPGLDSRTGCMSQNSLHSWHVKRGIGRHDLYSAMRSQSSSSNQVRECRVMISLARTVFSSQEWKCLEDSVIDCHLE